MDALNPSYKSENGVLLNRLGTTLILYPARRSGKSYDVPGVKTIESYAFQGATNLTSVKVSDSTTTIGKGAFRDCASLEKAILPNKLTKVEDEMFMGCKKLKELNFPTSAKTIGAGDDRQGSDRYFRRGLLRLLGHQGLHRAEQFGVLGG